MYSKTIAWTKLACISDHVQNVTNFFTNYFRTSYCKCCPKIVSKKVSKRYWTLFWANYRLSTRFLPTILNFAHSLNILKVIKHYHFQYFDWIIIYYFSHCWVEKNIYNFVLTKKCNTQTYCSRNVLNSEYLDYICSIQNISKCILRVILHT